MSPFVTMSASTGTHYAPLWIQLEVMPCGPSTFADLLGLHIYIGYALIPIMTTDGTTMDKVKKEIPIYERLAKGECLVILRDDDGVLVACNKNGDIALKRVPYPKRKGTGA